MKKAIILFIFTLYFLSSFAQDLIVTTEGDSLNCKITKEAPDYIYFTYNHEGEIRKTLLTFSSVRSYQKDYFEKSEIPQEKSRIKSKYPRIRLAAQGGWSYLIPKISDNLGSLLTNYMEELKTGPHFGFDFNYF